MVLQQSRLLSSQTAPVTPAAATAVGAQLPASQSNNTTGLVMQPRGNGRGQIYELSAVKLLLTSESLSQSSCSILGCCVVVIFCLSALQFSWPLPTTGSCKRVDG